MRLKNAARAALLLAVAACTGDATSPVGPTAPGGPSLIISDAAHAGAVPGFYFLPPAVPAPSYSGTFDAALSPRVEICELSGASCGPVIATYTMTSGSGSERVRVSTADQHYIVNWHTNNFNLDPAKTYRISVYSGTFLLGFADVDVVSSGKELKNVNTQQFIPLQDDRTLPIKFRIETGIVAQVVVAPPVDSINVGETSQFTATLIDLHGNVTTGPAVTWSSSNPAVATINASGLATGVAPGTVTITASLGYVSGTAQLTVVQPNTPPVANADTFQSIGNVTVPVAAPGVLANDTDADGNALSAVPGTFPTASGGTVTINADGSFSYLSAPGFTGTDSFTYTVTDGIDAASATVTMDVPTRVWYVSNTASGDGRDASPFATLAEAEAASAAGETIFVLFGNGTSLGYDAGITLKAGQSLTGQGIGADVTVTLNGQSVVLLDAGSSPTVTNAAAGTTIQLATNNTVQGLNVTSSAGAGIAGSGFGTFAASSISVAATGGAAVELQNGTAAAAFDVLSSSNSANAGLRLVNVGGTVSAPSGAISGAANAGVSISGGNAVVSYGGTVSAAAGRSVSITGRTGGSVTLSGDISDNGDGALVQNNTSGSIAFTGGSKVFATGASNGVTLASNAGATVQFAGGGLQIATTTGTGFSATGGGTFTVTGTGNSVGTSSGTAVRVVNTTLGAGGATFQSVSASNGANGIVLDNAGTGGFQVTGTGAPGSGGTIQTMSGDGVSLANTAGISLNSMVIRNNLGSGVLGTSVTGVHVDGSSVLDNGDNAAADEAGIRFDNLLGSSSIDNTTVAGSVEDNVRIVNTAGTLALSVVGSTIRDNAAGTGSDGLRLVSRGAAQISAAVQNSGFARNQATGLSATTEVGGSLALSVTGGSLQSNNVGVSLVHGSSGTFTFNVQNIPVITGQAASPININRLALAGPASTFSGTVSGNVIGTVGVTNSGAVAGPGVRVVSNGVGGAVTVAVTGNTIREVANRGIDVLARDGSSTINATITGNDIVLTSPISLDGIRVDAGALTTDAVTVCAAISGNTSTAIAGLNGIRVRQRFAGTTFKLAGYAGAPTNNAAVAAFLAGTNTVSAAAADNGGPGFTGVASCPTP
jgi:hypothetical protein